ncbi:MAG: hypothetical protein V1861_00980 [Candidatus Micrarchaeota archaeon]
MKFTSIMILVLLCGIISAANIVAADNSANASVQNIVPSTSVATTSVPTPVADSSAGAESTGAAVVSPTDSKNVVVQPNDKTAFSVIINENNKAVAMFEGDQWYDPCSITASAGKEESASSGGAGSTSNGASSGSGGSGVSTNSYNIELCTSQTLLQYVYTLGQAPEIRVLKRISQQMQPQPVSGASGGSGTSGGAGPIVAATSTSAQQPTLVMQTETKIGGVLVTEQVVPTVSSVSIAMPTSSGQSTQVVVEKPTENGKVLISTSTATAETQNPVILDEAKNAIYLESNNMTYQVYMTPDEAKERATEKGYIPSQGSELRVDQGMPTYYLYAKKPVNFLWFKVGEEDVLLTVTQTGEVTEQPSSG